MERLRVPWGPLLTQQEALRGLSYYGSGARIQAVASKLLAGQPIKARGAVATGHGGGRCAGPAARLRLRRLRPRSHAACAWAACRLPLQVFTLGASVTRGIGTTDRKYSYASRFFEFINAAFPHKCALGRAPAQAAAAWRAGVRIPSPAEPAAGRRVGARQGLPGAASPCTAFCFLATQMQGPCVCEPRHRRHVLLHLFGLRGAHGGRGREQSRVQGSQGAATPRCPLARSCTGGGSGTASSTQGAAWQHTCAASSGPLLAQLRHPATPDAQDADLVVLEFSANDKRDAAYTDPERRGYEQLVRKLLALPGRWVGLWGGDGWNRGHGGGVEKVR